MVSHSVLQKRLFHKAEESCLWWQTPVHCKNAMVNEKEIKYFIG